MTRINSLRLTDFRSYAKLDWSITGRISVLAGSNGAGKTNLLEAISLLSPGRGLRGAKLNELPRSGPGCSGGFAISAHVIENSISTLGFDLATIYGIKDRERRLFSCDGASISSREADAHFCSVWLTPQMDRLFTEGASMRRRFPDRLTLTLDPNHAREVAAFEAASINRNRLIERGDFDPLWSSMIEDAMARHAVALTASRLHLIDRLNATFADWDEQAFPPSHLQLDCPIAKKLHNAPALSVEDWLRASYADSRDKSFVQVSPQRADLRIEDAHTGLAASLASTGQQRAMLVALVLAHASLINAWYGRAPILLLDEPFMHLDQKRRLALTAHLRAAKNQVFCAVTEIDSQVPFGGDATYGCVTAQNIKILA